MCKCARFVEVKSEESIVELLQYASSLLMNEPIYLIWPLEEGKACCSQADEGKVTM